jgi:hypothetical protein
MVDPSSFHMVIDMQEARLTTVAQIEAFMLGTSEVGFVMPKGQVQNLL